MLTSVFSYVTLMNTLQTSVVVGALLRASLREPAACLADYFVISFMRSAVAVVLCETYAVRAIRRKSVSCAAMGERPRGRMALIA